MEYELNLDQKTTRLLVIRNGLSTLGDSLRAHVAPSENRDVAVITDAHVAKLYADTLFDSLGKAGYRAICHEVPAGEQSKCFAQLEQIARQLANQQLDRKGTIVALGGGMVSDLAGMAAATWMRGVRFVICPTTLEADIDACLGGKTAINLDEGKNLVGVFHQPELILVDPACLATLPQREFRAALAESVKHALISSESFLGWHEDNVAEIGSGNIAVVDQLVEKNLEIKAGFIERDAREQHGSRIMLNFGHTIGHAIESVCGYDLRHGECVGLGILAALRISHAMGLADLSIHDRVRSLLHALGLPIQLRQEISNQEVQTVLARDKKSSMGKRQFVLISDVGQPLVRQDVPPDLVEGAFDALLP